MLKIELRFTPIQIQASLSLIALGHLQKTVVQINGMDLKNNQQKNGLTFSE